MHSQAIHLMACPRRVCSAVQRQHDWHSVAETAPPATAFWTAREKGKDPAPDIEPEFAPDDNWIGGMGGMPTRFGTRAFCSVRRAPPPPFLSCFLCFSSSSRSCRPRPHCRSLDPTFVCPTFALTLTCLVHVTGYSVNGDGNGQALSRSSVDDEDDDDDDASENAMDEDSHSADECSRD